MEDVRAQGSYLTIIFSSYLTPDWYPTLIQVKQEVWTREEKAAAYKQKLKEQAEKRKKRKHKNEEDATSSEEEVEEVKEQAEDDSKKAKTYADMLEEEEIKKEAEVKKEENRIKRENIWKKRTVSNFFFPPFQSLVDHQAKFSKSHFSGGC